MTSDMQAELTPPSSILFLSTMNFDAYNFIKLYL